MNLRIHSFLPRSRANGPGVRAVVWLQGCPLACPGCCNPHMLDPKGGYPVEADELARTIAGLAPEIEGLTLSGGEPLAQLAGVTDLVHQVRELASRLSLVVFTGYSWQEIMAKEARDLMAMLDVVIAGRFVASRADRAGMLASSNQTVHLLSNRYHLADLADVPEAEITIDQTGKVVLTGVGAPRFRFPIRGSF